MWPRPGPRTLTLLLALLALAVAGCAGGASDESAPGTTRMVKERDFRIDAPSRVPAGDVTFAVYNRGPVAHELIIARGTRAGLPMRADGVTADEDAIEERVAGAIEPSPPGATEEIHAKLKPGRYVLFCNMSGHMLGGMHTELRVS